MWDFSLETGLSHFVFSNVMTWPPRHWDIILVHGARSPNFVRSSPILLEWWLLSTHILATKLVSTCEWQIQRNMDDSELQCLRHQGWYENMKFIEMHSRAIMS